MSFSTITLNGILHPVEEERTPQEFEQLSFNSRRYIGLEVEKVEVRLIIYLFALRGWCFTKMLDNVRRKMRNGEGIYCVIGHLGTGSVDWVYLRGPRFCSQAELLLRSRREEIFEGPFLRHSCVR